ncbi:MAG: HNH endonuclease [Vulcanimicrobiota bacterium]
MDTCEFIIEEPVELIDCDLPYHGGDSPDSRDIDEHCYDSFENDSCSYDPFFDEPDVIEGYRPHLCQIVERIEKGKPICDVDDLVYRIVTGRIERYDAAHKADSILDGILHKRLALDLKMGKFLKYLKKQGVAHLGYRTIGNFSVEHLSFSGRLASEMIRNFEVLSTLPLTKGAYLQGEIMKSALRHASRVMNPENEAEWLSLAQTLSLNGLTREVRLAIQESASEEGDSRTGASGEDSETDESGEVSRGAADITQCEPDIPSEESDEERKGVMMHLNVPHKLALIWDFAVEHFRNKEHYSGSLAGFVEALCGNFLASGGGAPKNPASENRKPENQASDNCAEHAALTMYVNRLFFPEKNESINAMYGDRLLFPEKNESVPIFYNCHMRPEEDPKLSHINDHEPPKRNEDGSYDDGPQRMHRLICFPPSFNEIPECARETAKRLIECALMRQALDVAMGKILWAMEYRGLYTFFNCGSADEYAIKYCDLSRPLLRRLIKLANGLERHPLVRDAFERCHITKEQVSLILKIVDKKNERAWIDYAAHVPTATLKEEVERCRRILEYDCLAAGYYAILPGFRYITDDRFHELPEEMQDIIRTGAWYQSPSMTSSWPLEEDDEQEVMSRDRLLEEPWKYFEDLDEFLIYNAEAAERRKLSSAGGTGRRASGLGSTSFVCASAAGQENSGLDGTSFVCASGAGQENSGLDGTSFVCASGPDSNTGRRRSSTSPFCATSPLCASSADCTAEVPSKHCLAGKAACSCGSCHDEETLSRAREICTVPHDASPAETFLMDILEDDSSSLKGAGMPIRFFLPEELYELWNLTFFTWLMKAASGEVDCAQVEVGTDSFFHQKEVSPREKRVSPPFDIYRLPMDYIRYAEDFLVALLQDYLLMERIHLKVSSNYAILKRDHFQCQVPGCKCRRNLQVHHIIWRSKGGCDEHWNLITLCRQHHKHILHDLMALKIEGTAPDNLTFTFEPNSGHSNGPFLVYHKGRKIPAGHSR